MKKDLSSAVAAIIGSLPGFTLPFVAALVLSPRDSDLLLLAVSVAVTQAVIVSSAADLTTIAEYGRLLGRHLEPSPAAVRAYRWRVVRFALLLTVLVTPALAIAYASRSSDRVEFVALVGVVAAAPVLAAPASMLSGECVARGAPVVPVAVGSMRTLGPAMLLLAWPSAPLWLVAAALPVGEGMRGGILLVVCRRLRRAQVRQEQEHAAVLPVHGLLAQATSQGVTQLGPAVDRLFLTSSGAGYISAYEMADRLMYSAAQFFSLTFVYRRVATWAQLSAMETDGAERLLRRDARTLGAAAAVLTVAGVLGCGIALASGLLPADWTRGFWWGAVVMLSVPAHGFNVVGTRLLVVSRKQHLMLWIAIATAVLNAALDTAFYLLFGPIGIVVATVVLRWVMAGVYLALLRVVVPQTIGQDLAELPADALIGDEGRRPASGHGHPVQQPHASPRASRWASPGPPSTSPSPTSATGPHSAGRSSTSRASSGTSPSPPPKSTPLGWSRTRPLGTWTAAATSNAPHRRPSFLRRRWQPRWRAWPSRSAVPTAPGKPPPTADTSGMPRPTRWPAGRPRSSRTPSPSPSSRLPTA